MIQEELRDKILQHSRSSKNGIFPQTVTAQASMTNPICGDHVTIGLNIQGGQIVEIGYRASSCALCSAAADVLCLEAHGRDLTQMVEEIIVFEKEVTENKNTEWSKNLGALGLFENVKTVPSRKVCLLLPSLTFRKAALASS